MNYGVIMVVLLWFLAVSIRRRVIQLDRARDQIQPKTRVRHGVATGGWANLYNPAP